MKNLRKIIMWCNYEVTCLWCPEGDEVATGVSG